MSAILAGLSIAALTINDADSSSDAVSLPGDGIVTGSGTALLARRLDQYRRPSLFCSSVHPGDGSAAQALAVSANPLSSTCKQILFYW